jgi:hypothetical protein
MVQMAVRASERTGVAFVAAYALIQYTFAGTASLYVKGSKCQPILLSPVANLSHTNIDECSLLSVCSELIFFQSFVGSFSVSISLVTFGTLG